MYEKLLEIEKRFEELSQRLIDTQLMENRQEYEKVAKERAQLEPIIEKFRLLKSKEKELEDAKEMLSSSEPEIKELAKQEIDLLAADIERLKDEIKVLLLPKDPNDEKNVILEIRAGTGGEEASLFASDLFRMYTRYADSKNWKVEILSMNTTGLRGIKEVIAMISGENVYSSLKYESGVHRVQRVPITEASGRIHTSTATVAVLPEADEIDIKIDEKDIEVEVCRASGPGGQGVNTTDSAVRIVHKPTGIVVSCQDERSQQKNKARALKILRARLLEMEREAQEREIANARRSQVGSGERAEKIRTYNFPQNRVTDHRIGYTSHKLDSILDGEIEELVVALRTYYQAEALKKGNQ
ncbi:MAG: peptide chain release factor 1 [Deltaproteobacteria bacterium]|nr:peptide chain release factor 1 [Deltaproteobacteria bacterium]